MPPHGKSRHRILMWLRHILPRALLLLTIMSLSINGIPVRSIARSFGLNTLVSASYIQNCHPSHLPGTPFAVTVHVGDCRTFTVVLACKVSQELDTDVVLASDWKIALRELFFSLGEPVPAFFDPWLLFLPSGESPFFLGGGRYLAYVSRSTFSG